MSHDKDLNTPFQNELEQQLKKQKEKISKEELAALKADKEKQIKEHQTVKK